MCISFGITCANRQYRNKFSRAYRVLYTDGSLCYLTEILDSAQEGTPSLILGFPYLYVNGEKYVFSREVLESGRILFQSFCELQHDIRSLYDK